MRSVPYFVCLTFFIASIGFLDDLYNLTARSRLCAQIFAALMIVLLGQVYLTDLGDIIGFGNVKLNWGDAGNTMLGLSLAWIAFILLIIMFRRGSRLLRQCVLMDFVGLSLVENPLFTCPSFC
ncbi:MAG: hypothetical protein ACOYMG_15005 [Candidatus Methylumidiphilus sp.]